MFCMLAPMQRPLRIGLCGLGNVGSGVAELLVRDSATLAKRAGGPLVLTHVAVRDPQRLREVKLGEVHLGTDAAALAADPDIDILVEVMGGIEPARSLVRMALLRGAHVVTANKELVARHGAELRAAALQGKAGLHLEAAVAGGIPIVKVLSESLTGNRLKALMGIVNGTTNYILTRMTRSGLDFRAALAEAQQLGYAEADPTADVDGHDAASKLAILAGLAFDAEVDAAAVHREGIGGITQGDIAAAADLGHVIKLLAIARPHPTGLELRVGPTMVPADHPLASVSDAFNAVFVEGDAVGELMLYGRGAGRLPTASAVLADIVDAAQDIRRGVAGRLLAERRPMRVLPLADVISRYYFSIWVADQHGALGAITTVLGRHGVSVESMIQKGRRQEPIDLVFVTHTARESQVRSALTEIAGLPQVAKIAQVLRVEGPPD